MPVESNIELGEGRLYITDTDELLKVCDCEATYEPDYTEDQEPYIKISQEPVTLTLDNVEMPKGWVLTECAICGYKFPITQLYSLISGYSGWLCPRCTFNKRLADWKRSK